MRDEELAALREIAQAVATRDTLDYQGDDGSWISCVFCNGDEDRDAPEDPASHERFVHEADCPVTKARALLASKG